VVLRIYNSEAIPVLTMKECGGVEVQHRSCLTDCRLHSIFLALDSLYCNLCTKELIYFKVVGNDKFKFVCHIFSSGVLFTGLCSIQLCVTIFLSDGDTAYVMSVFTNKFNVSKASNFRQSKIPGLH
jgi:hypothetical protein